MDYTDNKVKVTVTESHCPKYKVGDVIRFKGSDLDKEHSDNVCMVAIQAIYPSDRKDIVIIVFCE